MREKHSRHLCEELALTLAAANVASLKGQNKCVIL
jgi:hypothetical protein